MKTLLEISDTVSLPLELAARTTAILAQKGAGKTYAALRITEELLAHDQQVVALDPTGVWWGLRAPAVKGDVSFPVIVLGGEHADAPLEPTAGAIVARFAVESGRSLVLDLSGFESDGAQDRFATDFAIALYRLKAANRATLHLMVDEADSFAPQRPMPGQQRMLGAFEAIVRRGRSRGLGITLISQRPAVLNKNVLSQADLLIALRVAGVHDHKALAEYANLYGTPAQRAEFLESLPKFKTGEAWFWSPSWLGIFQRGKVSKRVTFDSSRTPEPGEKRETPSLGAVDLKGLSAEIASSVERAKANDPRELRKEIAELRRDRNALSEAIHPEICGRLPIDDLVKRAVALHRGKKEGKRVEVPVLTESQLKRLESAAQIVEKALEGRTQRMTEALAITDGVSKKLLAEIAGHLGKLQPNVAMQSGTQGKPTHAMDTARMDEVGGGTLRHPVKPFHATRVSKLSPDGFGNYPPEDAIRDAASRAERDPSTGITAPRQRILDALASLAALGLRDVDKSNAAVFADQSPTSSGFTNNLGALRTAGLIHYPQTGRVALTDAGLAAARSDGAIRTREDLHRAWFSKLPAPKVRILEQLIRIYPEAIEKAPLAELASQSPTSSGFTNNLGNLRSLGLIDYPQTGRVVATEILFPPNL